MAKDTPNKPDDKKAVPAGETKSNDKTAPGNEPEKTDSKAVAEKTVPPVPIVEDKKVAEVPAPEKGAEDKAKPPTPDKTADDEKLRQEQKALLKALDEKAAESQKKNPPVKKKADEKIKPFPAPKQPEEKKKREARPPKGPAPDKKEPPAPEKPPESKEAPRNGEQEEIVYLKLSELFPFKDHPFQVRDDTEMRAMVESVKDKGVTQPAIVRPREDGGYEIVSGHRRQKASELAGYKDIPCIVRNLTDEQAITQMVEDNTNQRENILVSERAKALKMQLEAIKRQGARDGGNGQRSDDIVGQRNKMTGKQVQRYIKLNELIPDLMKYVDHKIDGVQIGFTTALELAFISEKNQRHIAVAIEGNQASPNPSQAKRMRELDQKKLLKPDAIDGIMLEEKKEETRVILNSQELSKYFGPEKTPSEMKEEIIKALDEKFGQQKDISAPEKKDKPER